MKKLIVALVLAWVGWSPAASLAQAGRGTSGITGIYHGEHMITMRGCPGACGPQNFLVLGKGVKNASWTWNFDEGWAEIQGTTLTVGFVYEVQDLGNVDPDRNIAYFDDNGDGTYTLQHGFQIYNPNVGNPRADTSTKFRITQDGNRLLFETLDDEPDGQGDGIPGTQIIGIFPMTVQPGFDGQARLEGSSSGGDGISDADKLRLGLNPDRLDTDGDGINDADEIGDDIAAPLDSDGDSVIDALEPGDAAQDAARIGGLALLDGIPGAPQSEGSLSGETVALSVNNAWRVSAADTGNMALEAPEGGGAIPDTSLGDSGLDYRYGYTGFTVVTQNLVGAAPGSVTVRMAYSTPLPADKLLVYALTLDGAKEKYKLLPQDAWSRVDDRTLDVTFQDNGGWDIDSAQGVVRAGVAPVQNTLGGFEEKSGNGGGSLGGAVLLWLLAVFGLRRVAPTGMAYWPVAGHLPWRHRGVGDSR